MTAIAPGTPIWPLQSNFATEPSGSARSLEVAIPECRCLGAGPVDRPHWFANLVAVTEQDAGREEGHRVAAREGCLSPVDGEVVPRLKRLGTKELGEALQHRLLPLLIRTLAPDACVVSSDEAHQ